MGDVTPLTPAGAEPVAGAAAATQAGLRKFVGRLVREQPLGTAGGIVILILLLVSIFADSLAPYRYQEIHLRDRLQAPSAAYLLGTDHVGRDRWSRLIHGARLSLTVGLAATALTVAVAVLIGGTTGFIGGCLDLVTQRFVDAWMAFPGLLLLLTIMSIAGRGMAQIIIVLGVSGGIPASRVVRGAVLGVKENVYFQAAQAIGSSRRRSLLRHVLPNIAAPIIFSINVGGVIMSEAALSFLGFGLVWTPSPPGRIPRGKSRWHDGSAFLPGVPPGAFRRAMPARCRRRISAGAPVAPGTEPFEHQLDLPADTIPLQNFPVGEGVLGKRGEDDDMARELKGPELHLFALAPRVPADLLVRHRDRLPGLADRAHAPPHGHAKSRARLGRSRSDGPGALQRPGSWRITPGHCRSLVQLPDAARRRAGAGRSRSAPARGLGRVAVAAGGQLRVRVTKSPEPSHPRLSPARMIGARTPSGGPAQCRQHVQRGAAAAGRHRRRSATAANLIRAQPMVRGCQAAAMAPPDRAAGRLTPLCGRRKEPHPTISPSGPFLFDIHGKRGYIGDVQSTGATHMHRCVSTSEGSGDLQQVNAYAPPPPPRRELQEFVSRGLTNGEESPPPNTFSNRETTNRSGVTAQGPVAPRDIGAPSVAFRILLRRRHPEPISFRGSIPGPHVPLSTLHPRPRGRRRMTRGRRGSSQQPCRFLPAHRR